MTILARSADTAQICRGDWLYIAEFQRDKHYASPLFSLSCMERVCLRRRAAIISSVTAHHLVIATEDDTPNRHSTGDH